MRLGVLKEPEGETRVAIVPKSLRKLSKSGFEVMVESNAGIAANHYDSEYEENGAIISNRLVIKISQKSPDLFFRKSDLPKVFFSRFRVFRSFLLLLLFFIFLFTFVSCRYPEKHL